MIRPAVGGDAPALAGINRAAWALGDPPPVEELREGFAERLGRRDRTILVAEEDGAARGFVSFGDAEIHALYVHPSTWRKGTGRALLEHALAEMKAAGCKEATLWSLAVNAKATAFYEANGFAPDGATRTRPDTGHAEEIRFRREL